MLILKGVNIFPIQIEKKLMDINGVGKNFLSFWTGTAIMTL